MGGLKITKAIQQTQARKHFHCFSSGFCLHFVRFTSRNNKEGIRLDLKAIVYFQIQQLNWFYIYFKLSLSLSPYCEDYRFMSVSRCVVWRGVKKQKPRSRSWKANRLSARRWCPSASLRDLPAAEVTGSDVLIVLWSRHGALAPRRVRLTKVKSAGSIKAPAWLQGGGRAPASLDTFSQPQIIRKCQIIWLKKHEMSCDGDDLNYCLKLAQSFAGRLLFFVFAAIKDEQSRH